MKKNIILPAIALAWCMTCCNAPKVKPYIDHNTDLWYCEGLALFRDSATGKIGYVNTDTVLVIPPAYDFAGNFCEGLAAVAQNEKWGFIDRKGHIVVPPQYIGVGDFSEGLAIFMNDEERRGFIDPKGNIIIPALYARAHNFSEGLAGVMPDSETGKWFFIDRSGRQAIPGMFHDLRFGGYFKEGRAMVTINYKDEVAFIDKAGTLLYSRVIRTCAVVPESGPVYQVWSDQLTGFVDEAGREIIPPLYDAADVDEIDELVSVWQNNKTGCVDYAGKLVIPIKYDQLGTFCEGLAAFRIGCKWGFIDKTDKVVIPAQYDGVIGFSEGLAGVKRNGKWGFINAENHVIIPFAYEFAFARFANGVAPVANDGELFDIDKTGKRMN